MDIKFSLTLNDYIDFNLYHMKHSKSMKRDFIILKYIVPVILLICSFILYHLSGSGDNIRVYFYIVFGTAIYMVIFPRIYVNQIRKGIIKIVNEGNTEDLFGEQTISLKENYLENNTVGGCEQVKYDSIKRVEVNKQHVYIYKNAIEAFIIPISAFSSQEEKDKFMKILKEKTKSIN